ncbi:efflux RND transporter permease subunit [Shigella sonnei]
MSCRLAAWCSCSCVCRRRSYCWKTVDVDHLGQLPSGSTQQQTLKVVEQIEKYYFTHEKDNIMSVFATVGSGPGGNGQNVARMFIRLKNWSERDSKTGTSFAIIERATKAFNKIKEARVIASSPPALAVLVVLRVLIWSCRTTLGQVTTR